MTECCGRPLCTLPNAFMCCPIGPHDLMTLARNARRRGRDGVYRSDRSWTARTWIDAGRPAEQLLQHALGRRDDPGHDPEVLLQLLNGLEAKTLEGRSNAVEQPVQLRGAAAFVRDDLFDALGEALLHRIERAHIAVGPGALLD